jgi:hypothetical protein
MANDTPPVAHDTPPVEHDTRTAAHVVLHWGSTTHAPEYLKTHTHTTHLSAIVLINKGACDDGTCNA